MTKLYKRNNFLMSMERVVNKLNKINIKQDDTKLLH